MVLAESATVFTVSLLIGAFGIYVAAKIVTDVDDYTYAVITALLGAIVWGIAGFFAGWIPVIGSFIVLLAWISVINWRYPGDWVDAVLIGLTAWLSTLLVLYILASLGLPTYGAIGVPGTQV